MTIQWTCVAGFLYFEIFVAILLMLPFISAHRWSQLFKSRIMKKVSAHSTFYFNVLMVILAVLCLDAVREVFKYNHMEKELVHGHHHESENTILMKLFRAQRNLYVSGFALFMWFILRSMTSLLCQKAQLQAISEASIKQANSASDAAKSLMADKEDKKKTLDQESEKVHQELQEAKEKLELAEKESARLRVDLETLHKQSKGTNDAYDELLEEVERLQKQLQAQPESKKED